MSKSIVIIGGGIIGVASAWYLSRAGWKVQVIDRNTIGGACSASNCGLVCPSHVLPLTEPGAFKSALKALVTRNSAFKIQPRLDPALWSWFWQFAKRCNHDSMVQAAHCIQALLASAMSEYRQMVHEERLDCEWQAKGLLFVYRNSRLWNAFDTTNRLLREHFGEPAKKLNREETLELEPALLPQIAGGWFYKNDAHLHPAKLLRSMRERLEDSGVQFLEHCEMKSVEGRRSDLLHIETSQGPLSADTFLFACGAWTPMLNDHLGCRVPIQPGKGYSMTMPHPRLGPKTPMIFPEHHVVATPMKSGYRLGSIMEFVGYDDRILPHRLRLLRTGAENYLREPYTEPVLETWFGWRPMTYDSLPIIDRCPRFGNAWIATGHNMLGLSMAPATGRLVSELLDERVPHIDPAPYRLARFR